MKERPILFNGPMVRALLEGNKTQTRRVVKQELRQLGPGDWYSFDQRGINYRVNARHTTVAAWAQLLQFCPYGKPGDRLWVRETFHPIYPQDKHYNGGNPIEYDYAATYKHGSRFGDHIGVKKIWTPSIHMPREASRTLLDVVGVRVERLQEISAEDAIAEGLTALSKDDGRTTKYGIPDRDGWPGNDDDGWHWCEWDKDPRAAYRKLWEQINGPESWEANPWVWVVEFKRSTGGAA